MADFGQTDFGQFKCFRVLTDFGQTDFGQFWCLVFWRWFGLPCVWWVCSGPLRRTPLRRTPLRRTAQNFALFLPFPATVSLFLCLSGCLLVEFWWCFEGRNPSMCTFGLSGCRVKPRRPHQTGPPGLAHDSPRTPNVHISGHLRFKHHQNSTRKPPEREEKNQKGRKSAKFWAHPFGAPPFWVEPRRVEPRWVKHKNTKIGQSRLGPSWSL